MIDNTKWAIIKSYLYWSFWIGIAFFTIYPLCNWISSQYTDVYKFYIEQELKIPLVPEFIWAYLSMYILFLLPPFFLNVAELNLLGKRLIVSTIISGIVFIIFPSKLGFQRVVPDGFYGAFFANIFSIDLPYNMAPSLHVVYSGFIIFAIYQASKNKLIRLFLITWLALIVLSTLFVHQHHIADIVSAMILITLVSKKLKRRVNV